MANFPSPRELLGQALAYDPQELSDLDSELAQLNVRDLAGRLRHVRDELSVESAA